MEIFPDKATTMVLSEAEALELFAFLIASARTSLDDPAVYASMRLLTVFENLRETLRGRVSEETRSVLEKSDALSMDAQVNLLDLETYRQDLDALNRLLAAYLVAQSGLEGGA